MMRIIHNAPYDSRTEELFRSLDALMVQNMYSYRLICTYKNQTYNHIETISKLSLGEKHPQVQNMKAGMLAGDH